MAAGNFIDGVIAAVIADAEARAGFPENDRENFLRDSVNLFGTAVETELVGVSGNDRIVNDADFVTAEAFGPHGTTVLLANAVVDITAALEADNAAEFEEELVGAAVNLVLAFAYRRMVDAQQC
jgi:hypothetical protein